MDYEKLKKDFQAKYKNKMSGYSFEDLGQPTKPIIINRKLNKIIIEYEDRGILKIRLKELEKRPKTIFDIGLLFLYLTTGKRMSGFNRNIDEQRLKEMVENIISVEVGVYKKVLVFEELKN